MITIHHLGISQSERIVWLCEELGVPYRLVRYQRDPVTRLAPPEYKALHPQGTAPVITDDGLVLAESGAIIDYIIAKHGGGRLALTANSPHFSDYLYWYHFANATLMPSLSVGRYCSMLGAAEKIEQHAALRSILRRADIGFAMIEKRLGDADYFAGPEFTAADIMMLFPLTTLNHFGPRDLSPFANTRAYVKRIGSREAYQRAMKEADAA